MRAALALLAAGVLVAAPTSSRAWDWQTSAGAQPRVDFLPRRILEPDATGFWVTGEGNDSYAMVRYDLTGSPVASRSSTRSYDSQWFPGSDGSLLALDASFAYRMVRYGRAAEVVWATTLESSGSIDTAVADASGAIWVTQWSSPDFRLSRYSREGVRSLTISDTQLGLASIEHIAGAREGGGVYVVGASLGSAPRAMIVRVSPSGSIAWTWRDDALSVESQFTRLVLDDAGDVVAAGYSGSAKNLLAISTTPGGALRWRTVLEQAPASTVQSLASRAGSTYVLDATLVDPGRSLTLYRLDGSGANTLRVPLLEADYCNRCRVFVDASGAATVVAGRAVSVGTTPATAVVYDVPAAGTAVVKRTYPIDIVDSQMLPAGEIIGVANSYRSVGVDSIIAGELVRLDTLPGGALVPAVAAVLEGGSQLAAQDVAGDGSIVVVTRSYSANRYSISYYEASGRSRWSIDGAGSIRGIPSVSLSPALVCLGMATAPDTTNPTIESAVECLASEDGQQAWRRVLTTTQRIGDNLQVKATASRVIAVYSRPTAADVTEYHHASFGAAGQLLHDRTIGTTFAFAREFDASGTALVQIGNFNLMVVGPDGTSGPMLATELSGQPTVTLGPEAAVVDVNAAYNYPIRMPVVVRSRTAQGAQRWSVEIGTALSPIGSVVAGGGDYYVAWYEFSPPAGATESVHLARVSGVDGAIRWRRTIADWRFAPRRIAFDASTQALVLVSTWPGKTRVSSFDTASGEPRDERFEPCLTAFCVVRSARIDPTGTLRVVSSERDGRGFSFSLNGAVGAGQHRNDIRIDQPGVAGTWYAPYAPGQGFLIDYFPTSRTLFIPWFTYSGTGGMNPAELRWYSLQGDAGIGARLVELGIFSNERGAFDSGPVTTATRVGSATLAFSSCGRGELRYRFDQPAGGAEAGTISLARLLPASIPCESTTGSQPPEWSTPSAEGFDVRQSGAWYEPSTSGQGVMLSVLPRGLLFGAWFTYDPTARANDATAQHWFTIQGSFQGAGNGSVTLPIYETLGGVFDIAPTLHLYRIPTFPSTFPVGAATITFTGCANATLEYRFDSSEAAGSFGGLQDRVDLVRLGGCPL